MKRIIYKINLAFTRFKNHPITEKNSLFSFFRYYVWFNVFVFFKDEINFNWIKNVKLKIRKGDAGLVGNFYYGLHEFEESLFLLHYARKNDVFLDIGANLGHYSLLLSGIKECKSFAIEPVPSTYERLIHLIEFNKLENLIEPINIGVSDKKGELFFSTDKGTMNRIVSDNYLNKKLVDVKRIDEITPNHINILKMDVEGFEKFALEGAHKTLQSEELNVLILEINNSGKKYNVTDDEIFNSVIGYGFKPYEYLPNKRLLNLINEPNKNGFNTIFIKNKDKVVERIKKAEFIFIRNKKF